MKTAEEILSAACVNLEEDVLLALRYNYYARNKPTVPDAVYDEAESEFLFRDGVEHSKLNEPGSDRSEDYPTRAIVLSLYLMTCAEELAGAVEMTGRTFDKSKKLSLR